MDLPYSVRFLLHVPSHNTTYCASPAERAVEIPNSYAAVRLSETPGGIWHRAPVLGEHTGEVLAEIGYDEAAVALLHDDGVV